MDEKLRPVAEIVTWTKPALSSRRAAVAYEMVLEEKGSENGIVCRFKARLMAKGFFQKEDVH